MTSIFSENMTLPIITWNLLTQAYSKRGKDGYFIEDYTDEKR